MFFPPKSRPFFRKPLMWSLYRDIFKKQCSRKPRHYNEHMGKTEGQKGERIDGFGGVCVF